VVFTRCPELLQCSVCLLGLGGSSGGGSAVLLGSRGGGGEVDLRLGEDQPFLLRRRGVSLSPGGGASMIVYNVTQVALSGGAAKLY